MRLLINRPIRLTSPPPFRPPPLLQSTNLLEALGPEFVGTVLAPTNKAFEKLAEVIATKKIRLTPDLLETVLVRGVKGQPRRPPCRGARLAGSADRWPAASTLTPLLLPPPLTPAALPRDQRDRGQG